MLSNSLVFGDSCLRSPSLLSKSCAPMAQLFSSKTLQLTVSLTSLILIYSKSCAPKIAKYRFITNSKVHIHHELFLLEIVIGQSSFLPIRRPEPGP